MANGDTNSESNSNQEPMLDDPNLPDGWRREVSQRKIGSSAGKYDVYLFSPEGKKFRSRNELATFLAKTKSKLDIESFDFSVNGQESSQKSESNTPKRRGRPPKNTPKSATTKSNAQNTADKVRGTPGRKRKRPDNEEEDSDSNATKKLKPAKTGPAKKLVVKMPFSGGRKSTRRTSEQKIVNEGEKDEGAGGKRKDTRSGEKVAKFSSPSTSKLRKAPLVKKIATPGRGRPRKNQLPPNKVLPTKSAKPATRGTGTPGRKVKATKAGSNPTVSPQKASADVSEVTPRKRGRPPKKQAPVEAEAVPTSNPKNGDTQPVKESPRKTARIIKSPNKAGMVETDPVNILGTGSRKRGRPLKLRDDDAFAAYSSDDKPKKTKKPRISKASKKGQEPAGKQLKPKRNNMKSNTEPNKSQRAKRTNSKKTSQKGDQVNTSHRRSHKLSESNTQAMQDNLLAPLSELPEPFLSDSSNTETSGSESTQGGEHLLGSNVIQGSSLSESYPVLTEAMQTKAGIVFLDHSYATASLSNVKPKVVHMKQKVEAETVSPPPVVQVIPKAKKVITAVRKRSISESNLPKQTIIKLAKSQQSSPARAPSSPKVLYTMNPQQVPKTLPQQIFATPSNPAPPASPSSPRSLILPQTLAAVQAGTKNPATQAKVISLPVGKGAIATQSIITLPGGGHALAQTSSKISEGGQFITLPLNAQGVISAKGTRTTVAQNPKVITMAMANTSPISPANLTAIQLGAAPKGARRISFSVGVPPKANAEKEDNSKARNSTASCPSSSPKQRSA